jgi:nickel transport protein
MTGTTDEEGRFRFTPDSSTPGTWDVQVRQSGHGDMVHIPIGGDMAVSGGTGYSTPQILLMAACVVWGLFGTGLYFSKKRETDPEKGID